MLAKKISSHLKKLSQSSPSVRRQFCFSNKENSLIENNDDEPPSLCYSDPLLEDIFEKTKGLIHKYNNRVLILLTLQCTAYCRFCTRRRLVSEIKKGALQRADIDNMANYLIGQPDIKEVIFSGGDPLTVPETLNYALSKISKLKQIKIIRIGTRVPVAEPKLITNKIINIFKKISQPLYIGIHFEHPDEITKETILACKKLRQAGAILYSQSVFLKGVNDNYKTLYNLFSSLIEIGVKPYYIYRCDPVKGAEHFRVSFKKEIAIMTKLRKNLSGMAYPTYVIDTPNGSGKIPVPLNFWDFDSTKHLDFLNENKKII
ncbi:MAG: KamA family radical SAM protein [Patescibacteria group bacterium]